MNEIDKMKLSYEMFSTYVNVLVHNVDMYYIQPI